MRYDDSPGTVKYTRVIHGIRTKTLIDGSHKSQRDLCGHLIVIRKINNEPGNQRVGGVLYQGDI
jgi:hypothetical protein